MTYKITLCMLSLNLLNVVDLVFRIRLGSEAIYFCPMQDLISWHSALPEHAKEIFESFLTELRLRR